MKIPLNWLGELVNLPKIQNELTDKLTSVGHMIDKVETIDNQTVLDLELRGNRADCYSILGIAREVAAIYNNKIKILPVIDKFKKLKKLKNSTLEIKTDLVKRAAMVEIYNVTIIKSPKWLASKLALYGIESVNNIVDLTNYVMIETGEPMHAFDLDKVTGGLQVRLAKKGEKIITFQGSSLTLTKEDLVWTKGNTVLSVAGSIGEKNHSITDTTKNILLEAANYDRANIRRTVYRHNLLTDAGIRHEKDLDPNMVEPAIGRFLYFIKKYSWGNFKDEIFDYYPKPIKPWKLTLDLNYFERISGIKISIPEIKNILKSLNFENIKIVKNILEVLVPTYRTDVTLEEDLIEEILRIYGYDKIPTKILSLEIPTDVTPNYILQEVKVKQSVASLGFNEVISLSFVTQKFNNLNQNHDPSKTVISLQNPPSPDNKDLRVSLLPNLYKITKKAVQQLAENTNLFEVGKVYFKAGGKYKEKRSLGIIYRENQRPTFENFKKQILGIFKKLNLDFPIFENELFNLPLRYSYLIKLDKKEIGFGGQIGDIFYVEIDLDSILDKDEKYSVKLWPKFPPQIEDITLVLPEKTRVGDVLNTIKSVNQSISKAELKEIYKDFYTFNIWYQNPSKTLTDDDVKIVREKILKEVKSKFGATLKD